MNLIDINSNPLRSSAPEHAEAAASGTAASGTALPEAAASETALPEAESPTAQTVIITGAAPATPAPQLHPVELVALRTNANGTVTKILFSRLPDVGEALATVLSPLGVLLQRGLGYLIAVNDEQGTIFEVTMRERQPSQHLGFEIGAGGAAEHYEWLDDSTNNSPAALLAASEAVKNQSSHPEPLSAPEPLTAPATLNPQSAAHAAARKRATREGMDIILDEINQEAFAPLLAVLRAALNNERGWQSKGHDLERKLKDLFSESRGDARQQHFETLRDERERLFYRAPDLLASYANIFELLISGPVLSEEEHDHALAEMRSVLRSLQAPDLQAPNRTEVPASG